MKHSDDGRILAECYVEHPQTVLGEAMSMEGLLPTCDDSGRWLKGESRGSRLGSASEEAREVGLGRQDSRAADTGPRRDAKLGCDQASRSGYAREGLRRKGSRLGRRSDHTGLCHAGLRKHRAEERGVSEHCPIPRGGCCITRPPVP